MSLIHRFATLSLSLVFILACSGNVYSQPEEGPVVRQIDIQYAGPASISRERILANMRTAVGQPYSELVVEEDIRNLYATTVISNVRIYTEPLPDGVRVVVIVQTRASVSEVRFEGVSQVSVNRLRKEIATEPEQSLSEAQLEEDRQKILAYYQARGYSEASVTYRVETNEAAQTSSVVFAVDEGDRRKVRRIRFEGNNTIPEKELRKVMKTKPKNILSVFTKAGRAESDTLDADAIAIRDLYQEKGYADAEVVDIRRESVGDKSMDLVVVINEGPQYKVGTLTISGNQLLSAEDMRSELKMVEGAPYSPKLLRDDISTIQKQYGKQGYIDVMILPTPTSRGPQVVDVNYAIEEGFQSYVEKVNISGNTRTKDKVIRRELVIAPGDVYDTSKVELSRQRLANLNYFERTEAYPSDTFIPGRKDLNLEVEEKRTGSFNFGAGFSSIDNLIGFAEVTQSNFDITNWPSMSGGGQRFRTRVQFGTKRKDFIISLTEPWFMDYQVAVGGELFYRESTFFSDVYDQRNYGLALNARKPLGNFTSLRTEYRLENIEIFDVDDDVSEEIRSQEGEYLKSQLLAGITYDTRDSVFLTRKGHRVDGSIYAAGGPLAGDVDVYGWNLEGSKYFLLPKDFILQVVGEVATVETWSGGEEVPIFDRLFLGGANTLRGFKYREVGPKDENDEPIGGQTLSRFTAEVSFPIIDRIRGAVFYDVGFVNRGSYDFSAGDVNSDAGVGLRFDLPIGPVRVDFGIPLQADSSNDSSGRFNFNIGYQF